MNQENQKLLRLYFASLAIGGCFYILYWFSPWLYGGLDSETQGILSYGGFAAWFEIPDWLSWALLLLVVASYAGMFFFRKAVRLLFLVVIIFNIVVSPAYGISVITGLEVLIIDVSTLLSGFVLGLAYYSPLKDRFV